MQVNCDLKVADAKITDVRKEVAHVLEQAESVILSSAPLMSKTKGDVIFVIHMLHFTDS